MIISSPLFTTIIQSNYPSRKSWLFSILKATFAKTKTSRFHKEKKRGNNAGSQQTLSQKVYTPTTSKNHDVIFDVLPGMLMISDSDPKGLKESIQFLGFWSWFFSLESSCWSKPKSESCTSWRQERSSNIRGILFFSTSLKSPCSKFFLGRALHCRSLQWTPSYWILSPFLGSFSRQENLPC